MIIDGQVRSGAQASGRRVSEMAPRTNTLRVIIIVVIGLFMACSESFIFEIAVYQVDYTVDNGISEKSSSERTKPTGESDD